MKISTLKYTLIVVCISFSTVLFSQSKENKLKLKQIIKLSTETEFSQIAKMFDTTNGKKPINPFILDYLWRDFEGKYGDFKTSKTIDAYEKKGKEVFWEELEFDSAYVTITVGFNPKNGMVSSYLLKKQETKADRELAKKYTLPQYAKKGRVINRKAEFGIDSLLIEGELTLPHGLAKDQKVPVVILVHGSGPGDRNAKSGPLQPFKDIAYGLSTKGTAVLRYDKRTLTYADECGADKEFTVNKETVDDAVYAAEYLRAQKNIDPNKIFVLGHSLGGMMMPRIGLKDPKLAGLIFMAAPAKSLPDKVIEQMDYLATLEPSKKKAYEKQKEDFIRLKTKWYDSTTSSRYLPFGVGPIYWFDLDNYKQTEVVKNVQQPMLFLQGEADYQVTVEDFNLWKEALKGNNKATFKLFPKLHHNMGAIDKNGLSKPGDYKVPVNVSEEVVTAIYNWVTKQ